MRAALEDGFRAKLRYTERSMRPRYSILCLALFACGDKPVGSKVPRAKPAHVAGVAAAAATLATLADPAAAKHKQEQRGSNRALALPCSVCPGACQPSRNDHGG